MMAVIEAWAEARRINELFKHAEQRLAGLGDEDRTAILEQLKRAREFLGGVDVLERFKSWKTPEERWITIALR
jgi:hypothetical protein